MALIAVAVACLVASAGPFDLNDVRTEVGENEGRDRPGNDVPKLHHLYAVQRTARAVSHSEPFRP